MTMKDVKQSLMDIYKQSYYEGTIDTINNIQKALVGTKTLTGQYPDMELFVYKLLPEMRDIETKKYEENKNAK